MTLFIDGFFHKGKRRCKSLNVKGSAQPYMTWTFSFLQTKLKAVIIARKLSRLRFTFVCFKKKGHCDHYFLDQWKTLTFDNRSNRISAAEAFFNFTVLNNLLTISQSGDACLLLKSIVKCSRRRLDCSSASSEANHCRALLVVPVASLP